MPKRDIVSLLQPQIDSQGGRVTMQFKKLANALRICVGYMVVLTALAGATHAAAVAAPEVDPGMAGSAVALVVGGYLVFVSKLRRK
jgi:hypothetical protein